jgi:hypothetical protein
VTDPDFIHISEPGGPALDAAVLAGAEAGQAVAAALAEFGVDSPEVVAAQTVLDAARAAATGG